MTKNKELPFIDNPEMFSAELRRLTEARTNFTTKNCVQKISSAEKREVFDKTNGLCHFCGEFLSYDAFGVTTFKSKDGEKATYLPACKNCKRIFDKYLPEEIKWIIRIGQWAKTHIEFETETGLNIANEIIDYEIDRENQRVSPREPYKIDVEKYPIKEHFIYNPKVEIQTLKELLYWSYSNFSILSCAWGKNSYTRFDFILRRKNYQELMSGKMEVHSLFADEKRKLSADKCCVYCGSTKVLQIDHIIPKNKGGKDSGENLVWACRSCNASKNDTDLLEWYSFRNEFPPTSILLNYMKLVIFYCKENSLMDLKIEDALKLNLPFSLHHIPLEFPKPNEVFGRYCIDE